MKNTDINRQREAGIIESLLELVAIIKEVIEGFLKKKLTFRDLRNLSKSLRGLDTEYGNKEEINRLVDNLSNQFNKKI